MKDSEKIDTIYETVIRTDERLKGLDDRVDKVEEAVELHKSDIVKIKAVFGGFTAIVTGVIAYFTQK
jgi:hypothetical protein